MRREVLTWSDVDKLIDYIVPQIQGRFDSMMIITRGGIIPGGLLAEALNITYLLTASVRFPADFPGMYSPQDKFVIPEFIQFIKLLRIYFCPGMPCTHGKAHPVGEAVFKAQHIFYISYIPS